MKFTIVQARKFANKTQREMAALMGICRDTYRNIEQNPDSATVQQAKAISQITNIPIDQIFLPSSLPKVEYNTEWTIFV